MTGSRAVILAGLCALAPVPALAQSLLRLQPNGNEVGAESRAERWWYDGFRPSQFAMFGEWVSVSATGMLVSPRLFSWSGTVRPYFGQQNGTGANNGLDTRNLGLSLGGNLFAAFPLSVAFNTHRSSGRLRSGGGGETEFATSGAGSIISWRNRWFPMMLDVSRRATDDNWTSLSALTPIRRNEVLRDVRLVAQSTKTNLLIDNVSYRDRLGSLSFRATDGTLEHALRWGSGSALNTSLQAGHREGSYPYSRTAASARVLLRHADWISSDYYVQRRNGTSSGVAADNRSGGASVRVQNRPWWSNTLSAAWNGTQYPDNRNANAVYSWRSQVNKRARGGATLSGALSATLERMSQVQTGSADIVVDDERHTVDESRAFLLNNVRVDTTTIMLRSEAQTIEYAPDIDYRLVMLGTSVRVQLLPGSRLAVGDRVIARYRFNALRSGRHTVEGLAADVSLGSNHVVVRGSESVRHATGTGDAQDARLLSGRDRLLGVTLRHSLLSGRVELHGQHSERLGSMNDFSTDEVRLAFSPPGSNRWQSNVGIRGSKSTVAREQLTLVSGDVAVNWTVTPTLRILGTSEHWIWQPSRGLTERFITSSLEATWQFGRVESSVRYLFQRRTARLDNNQHRVTARLVRRF